MSDESNTTDSGNVRVKSAEYQELQSTLLAPPGIEVAGTLPFTVRRKQLLMSLKKPIWVWDILGFSVAEVEARAEFGTYKEYVVVDDQLIEMGFKPGKWFKEAIAHINENQLVCKQYSFLFKIDLVQIQFHNVFHVYNS